MLTNVILLCFMVLFLFAIIGLQLWKGQLRNRCFPILDNNRSNQTMISNDFNLCNDFNHDDTSIIYDNYSSLFNVNCSNQIMRTDFYRSKFAESFVCTRESGMRQCSDIKDDDDIGVNATKYECLASGENPFNNAISFDNIFYSFLAIFQVITMENWVYIQYHIQDAYSFWSWIYFILLVIVNDLDFHFKIDN
jgi:hypothetical protein